MRAVPRPTGWFAQPIFGQICAVWAKRGPVWGIAGALCLGACYSSTASEPGYVDPGHTGGAPNNNQLSLSFEGEPIRLAPRTDAQLTVRVQPAAAYRVRFSLLDSGVGGATSGAALNRDEVVSGPDGRARVVLTTPSSPTRFDLRAEVDSFSTTTSISVEAGALTTLDVVPDYSGSRQIDTWTASVYPSTSCSSFQSPPGDGPYLVRAPVGAQLRLADIPAAAPLAVVVRADALAAGCTTLATPTPNGETSVNVSVSNTPLSLERSVLDLVFGLPADDAAFKADLQAGAALALSSLQGTAANDVSAVLDGMAALLDANQRAAFTLARNDASWDTSAPLALGRYAPTRLDDALTRWLRDGQAALLSNQAFQLRIAADANQSELPSLLPQRMGGVSTDVIAASASGTTWSVDPEDTLAFSASLSWPAASLVCALIAAPSIAETGEIQLSEAFSSVLSCEALGAHLASSSTQSAADWAASCDAACEIDLCHQALGAMVGSACAASNATPSTLSILATGSTQVGLQAEARSFSGSWVGRLARGNEQASSSGSLRGSAPRGF